RPADERPRAGRQELPDPARGVRDVGQRAELLKEVNDDEAAIAEFVDAGVAIELHAGNPGEPQQGEGTERRAAPDFAGRGGGMQRRVGVLQAGEVELGALAGRRETEASILSP